MFAHSFVLVNHSEWNVSTHSDSSRPVSEGAQVVRSWVRGTWFPHLGVCEDVAERQFLPCGCGRDLRYHGDAISKLVILGQMLCAIGSGASLVSISGRSHPCGMLQRVSGERIHAKTVGLSNLRRQVADTLPTKDCLHCVWHARSVFDDRSHRYPTQRRWASWLDAVEAVSAKGDWDRWPFSAWAGGCCQQHNRVLAAYCLLPQGDWQKRQRR